MKSIKLSQLTDLIRDESKIIYSNYQIATTSLSEMVAILVKAQWIDDDSVIALKNFDGELFNRNYRLWRISLIENLQFNINKVSKMFNEQGLLLPPDYEEIRDVRLCQPLSISFDEEYKTNMNSNFELTEARINNLYITMKDAGLMTE